MNKLLVTNYLQLFSLGEKTMVYVKSKFNDVMNLNEYSVSFIDYELSYLFNQQIVLNAYLNL